MTAKNNLTNVLRLVVATIERLEPDQVDQLISGKAKLAFIVAETSEETTNPPPPDQAGLLERLNECTDRNEARHILRELPNRNATAAFARTLKIHVVKHDRREDIESKIVESVIGGKLRTEAIRSLNLKASGRSTKD